MKMLKRKIMPFIMSVILILSCVFNTNSVNAAAIKYPDQKMDKYDIICMKIKGDYLYYHRADWISKIVPDPGWTNVVGYGKLKKIKLSKKAKYKLMNNFSKMTCKKVSKKKFSKRIKSSEPSKHVVKGHTWYWGMYARIKVKKGKIINITQMYQS